MTIKHKGNQEYEGLSTDTKPLAADTAVNATFLETDTRDQYYNNGTAWIVQDGGAGAWDPAATETLTNKTLNNDSNTFPYVGAYSAVIYKSGSVYKSKKADGTLLASSTTLDGVVQAALDVKGTILWPGAADGTPYFISSSAAWNVYSDTRLLMDAWIVVPAGYAGTLFTIDDTTGGAHVAEKIHIRGGFIQEGGTPQALWTGLELKSASSTLGSGGIAFCTFRDMFIKRCNIGVKLTAVTGSNSWINGNTFDSITVNVPHIGFDFNIAGSEAANTTARNTFINCIAQADRNQDNQTQLGMISGFRNIGGRENTFYHCKSWDVSDTNSCSNITSLGTDTVISGGLLTYVPIDWEITKDLGERTVIFPENASGASGYNAALINPFIRKTGTYSGMSSTSGSTTLGDGLLNTIGVHGTGTYTKATASANGQAQQMDTTGTINTVAGIRTTIVMAVRNFNPLIKARFKLNQTTAQKIFVGFHSSPTAITIGTADDPLVSLTGYGLYHSTTHGTSATNWLTCRNTGSATSTFANTGVAANVTTPQTITIGAYETTTPFFRSRVGTNVIGGNTSTIPPQFTNLGCGVWISNTAAASKTCDVYSMFFKNGIPEPV